MTETEGEMSAQKMCGHHGLKKVDYYDGWHILCTCGASFWDGHEYSDSHTAFNAHLQKMNAAAIAEAEERGRLEVMPLITQGDGCIVFEWWRGGRKLTLRCPRVNEMVKRNNTDREEIDVPDEAGMQAAIRWLNESCSTPSRSIDAIIAEAEERGRVEEREACAEIARLEVAELGPLYNLENIDFGAKLAAEQIIEDIRARTTPPPAKERE